MTDTLLSYLAGVLDSEGFITILKQKERIRDFSNRPNTYRFNPHYKLSVGACMKCPIVMKIFKEKFGGVLYLEKGKNIYRWHVCSEKAKNVLETLEKYLLVKKKQAILGIDYQSNKKSDRFGKGGRLTENELLRREKYFQNMRELNQEYREKCLVENQ